MVTVEYCRMMAAYNRWMNKRIYGFNHQTHHRGQLTTLLSQAGHDPGVTDLIRLPGLFETPS